MPFVYLLRCRDGSLYAGAAMDLDRRLAEHAAGRASRYTRSRRPVALFWSREVATWTPVVMFISMVPFSISSIGITEGAYVWCFLLAGVPREASLGVALLMRLKLVLLGVAGGVVYLMDRGECPPRDAARPEKRSQDEPLH